jgi:SOS response regulatory protein OraA/RecX
LAERFLDEERFARGFVADKTNLSGWGRRKVLAALAIQHGVKGQAAQAAIIAGLDEARYTERLHTTLQAEFRRYGTQQPEELPREHLHAIVRRLAARGYTSTEIWHAVGRSGPDFDHETTLHLGTDTHNP